MSASTEKSGLAGERAKLVIAIDLNRDQSLLRLMRAMIDLGEAIKRDGNATTIAYAAGVIEALNSARLGSAPAASSAPRPAPNDAKLWSDCIWRDTSCNELGSDVSSTGRAGQFCSYPKCTCPFYAPGDLTWCARGLPHQPAGTPPKGK